MQFWWQRRGQVILPRTAGASAVAPNSLRGAWRQVIRVRGASWGDAEAGYRSRTTFGETDPPPDYQRHDSPTTKACPEQHQTDHQRILRGYARRRCIIRHLNRTPRRAGSRHLARSGLAEDTLRIADYDFIRCGDRQTSDDPQRGSSERTMGSFKPCCTGQDRSSHF